MGIMSAVGLYLFGKNAPPIGLFGYNTGMQIPLRTDPSGERFHYERALKRLKDKTPLDTVQMDELHMELAMKSPIGSLPRDVFLQILRATVESHRLATGNQPTKTFIEMKAGLDVLVNGAPPASILKNTGPFDWEGSLSLLGPLTAFIYQRMHAEVRLINSASLPDLDLSLVQVQQDAVCVVA